MGTRRGRGTSSGSPAPRKRALQPRLTHTRPLPAQAGGLAALGPTRQVPGPAAPHWVPTGTRDQRQTGRASVSPRLQPPVHLASGGRVGPLTVPVNIGGGGAAAHPCRSQARTGRISVKDSAVNGVQQWAASRGCCKDPGQRHRTFQCRRLPASGASICTPGRCHMVYGDQAHRETPGQACGAQEVRPGLGHRSARAEVVVVAPHDAELDKVLFQR